MVMFTLSVFHRISVLGKFGPNISNCCFKVKFGTQTNFYMQYQIVVYIFFCFLLKITFFGKRDLKIPNCFFKVKFDIQTNWNKKYPVVMLIFSVFIWKYACLEKLFQTSKLFVDTEIWN